MLNSTLGQVARQLFELLTLSYVFSDVIQKSDARWDTFPGLLLSNDLLYSEHFRKLITARPALLGTFCVFHSFVYSFIERT